MKKVFLFLILGLFLFSMTFVSALQPEYQSVSFPVDYQANALRDVIHEQTYSFPSVSEFTFLELEIFADFSNTEVEPFVNGISCTPSVWTAPSQEGYKVRFDCTDAVVSSGQTRDITVGYRVDKDTENLYGTLKATYLTRGEPVVEVHGTEYTVGQQAKVWLQLLDGSGESVDDGVCYVDIYTPDNEEYLEHATMSNMEHDGVYYFDLSTNSFDTGVYPVLARCYYDAIQDKRNASSYDLYWGSVDGGNPLSYTYIQDGDEFKLDTEDVVNPINRLNVTFTFSDYYSSCGGVAEELLTGATIYWYGKWDTGTTAHDMESYIYNYTSTSWINLPNEIGGGNGGTRFTNTNSLEFNNVTTALGITASNPLKMGFVDNGYDEGSKDFDTDRFYVSCDQLANPEWQEIKGSSEMHLSDPLNSSLLTFDIWNYSMRELTNFPFDVNAIVENTVDATVPEVLIGGTEYQIGDTGKLSVRLIKSQGGEGEPETGATCNGSILYPNDTLYIDEDTMTEYGQGVYTLDFSAPSTEGVYTYFVDCFKGNATENVSYYTLNTFHISDVSDDVWTATTRDLTYYESADETDYDLIQTVVWNSTTRDLTYYETANITIGNSSVQAIGDAVWDYEGEVNDNLLVQFGQKVECYVKNLLGGDDEWAVEIASC